MVPPSIKEKGSSGHLVHLLHNSKTDSKCVIPHRLLISLFQRASSKKDIPTSLGTPVLHHPWHIFPSSNQSVLSCNLSLKYSSSGDSSSNSKHAQVYAQELHNCQPTPSSYCMAHRQHSKSEGPQSSHRYQ